MRDALKNLFTHQIVLEDNSLFQYTIQPYELTNALGNIIAVLQEYDFIKKDDHGGKFSCKLYRTSEGNWYDLQDANIMVEKGLLRLLKSAIDAKENSISFK